MAGSKIVWEGIKEFEMILNDIPKEIREKGQRSAGRKAAKLIERQAKSNILKDIQGSDGGFSKLELASTQIGTYTYKGGITVGVKRRAIDIPLQLRGRSGFQTFAYLRLIAQGRQWTAKTTNSRRNKWTGYTAPMGDWVEKAFDQKKGEVETTYRTLRIREIQKAFDKAVRKHNR